MSQNNPYFFGADSGYAPPSQVQQYHSLTSDPPLQASGIMPPQQMAFQQTAQIAGADMSALEGISPEQLAAIARLFQSGALQMPPPPAPSVSVRQSHPRDPPPDVAQPVPSDRRVQQPPPNAADIDMDTEEGEVDESEEINTQSKVRDFLRPPPTGPSNRSVSPRDRPQKQPRKKASPGARLSNQAVSDRHGPQNAQSNQVAASGKRTVSNHDAAKMFVLEMVKAGYSYEDILPDIRNSRSLIAMFRELGLPTTASNADRQPSQPDATPSLSASTQMADAKPATTATIPKATLLKRPAPTKPVLDRSEYLARLQAAKNKKTETTTSSEPPAAKSEAPPRKVEPVPSESRVLSTNATPQSQPSTSAVSKSNMQPLSPNKKAKMTELARVKLEALKAKQAAARAAATKPDSGAGAKLEPSPSSAEIKQQLNSDSSQNGLGAGLAEISSQVAQGAIQPQPAGQKEFVAPQSITITQATASPVPQTPTRSFSGLPGLFMSGNLPMAQDNVSSQRSPIPSQTPAQSSSSANDPQSQLHAAFSVLQSTKKSTTMSPVPVSGLRKRAVAADFDDISTTQSSVKRPFGQSRNASEDESLVIQVSDDEDEEDDAMDIEPVPDSSKPILQTKSFRDVGPLRDFPPKPSGQAHSSAQSSAPTTPGSVTYQQKMKEIEEMKRQIAERQEKKKATPMKAIVPVPVNPSPLAGSAAAESDVSPPNVATQHLTMKISPEDSMVQATPPVEMPSMDKAGTAAQLAKNNEDLLQERLEDAVEELNNSTSTPERTVDANPAMSGALPDTVHITQSTVHQPAGDLSESEEGEISDDSMSNFYDLQDNDDQNQLELPANESRGGSHATTVTPTDESTGEAIDAPSEVPAAMADADDDVDMDDIYDPATAIVAEESDQTESMEEGETEDDSSEEDSESSDVEPQPTSFQNGATGGANGASEELDSPSPSPAPFVDGKTGPEFLISEPGRADTREEVVADNDAAPELQPTDNEVALLADQIPAKSNRFFTPYHSPLTAFKDYRYHPDYLNTVSGGFKSITYNNAIDPYTPVCPVETAGGQCGDQNCPYQHFNSMVISDNDMIQNMGTKDAPVHNPEERKTWNKGLGALVSELRTANLNSDADAVAARVAQFRRDFVDDPTKILNLG